MIQCRLVSDFSFDAFRSNDAERSGIYFNLSVSEGPDSVN